MKVLSLTQPWATLVVIGAKKFETRSWRTDYRGELLIHAAKGFPKWAKVLITANTFSKFLNGRDLPTGAIIGKVELVKILGTGAALASGVIDETEETFGDYAPGRFAWMLRDAKEWTAIIPAKGALGIWEYNP